MGRHEYWDSYYSSPRPGPVIPSQFAAFVAAEYLRGHQVMDFGCGNGRDSLFFATVGAPVLGLDGSSKAVELCTGQAEARGLASARFLRRDLDDPALPAELAGLRPAEQGTLLYARFFLHAITDPEEQLFFEIAAGLMRPERDLLAMEFRTHRDRDLPKQTVNHFRRYVDPLRVLQRAAGTGLATEYFVEGFGFAKYGSDDAHVARFVLRRLS